MQVIIEPYVNLRDTWTGMLLGGDERELTLYPDECGRVWEDAWGTPRRYPPTGRPGPTGRGVQQRASGAAARQPAPAARQPAPAARAPPLLQHAFVLFPKPTTA